MKFKVLKSSFDGICGGDAVMTIDQVCQEICCARGWDDLEHLRNAIRTWAKVAKPGAIFKTWASAIVATRS